MVFYVDDGLLLEQDKTILRKVVDELERVFEVTASEPGFDLGTEIKREKEDGPIIISRASHID